MNVGELWVVLIITINSTCKKIKIKIGFDQCTELIFNINIYIYTYQLINHQELSCLTNRIKCQTSFQWIFRKKKWNLFFSIEWLCCSFHFSFIFLFSLSVFGCCWQIRYIFHPINVYKLNWKLNSFWCLCINLIRNLIF